MRRARPSIRWCFWKFHFFPDSKKPSKRSPDPAEKTRVELKLFGLSAIHSSIAPMITICNVIHCPELSDYYLLYFPQCSVGSGGGGASGGWRTFARRPVA